MLKCSSSFQHMHFGEVHVNLQPYIHNRHDSSAQDMLDFATMDRALHASLPYLQVLVLVNTDAGARLASGGS